MTRQEFEMLLRESGVDPVSMPKYDILPDGTVYFYTKEEDKDALREQAPPLQEGISTTEGSK
jgi:hypothetical protein